MLTISVRSTQPTPYPTGTRFSCCQIRVAHVVQVRTRRFGALTPEGNRGERVMLVTQLLQNQRGRLERELPIGPVRHSGSFCMMLAHLIDRNSSRGRRESAHSQLAGRRRVTPSEIFNVARAGAAAYASSPARILSGHWKRHQSPTAERTFPYNFRRCGRPGSTRSR